MLLQSFIKAAYFLTRSRTQRNRKMSAPSQLQQVYEISVPEVLITWGMWQRKENILTKISPVISVLKFSVQYITDLGQSLSQFCSPNLGASRSYWYKIATRWRPQITLSQLILNLRKREMVVLWLSAISLTMKTGHWDWLTVIASLKRWAVTYSPLLSTEVCNDGPLNSVCPQGTLVPLHSCVPLGCHWGQARARRTSIQLIPAVLYP